MFKSSNSQNSAAQNNLQSMMNDKYILLYKSLMENTVI